MSDERAPQPLSVAQGSLHCGILISTLEDIISVYEWCSVDPYDRGYSALDNEIHRAKHLLAQRQPDSGAWRPIETAPRDGSWIIALCNDGTQTYHVYWQADQEAWYGHHGAYGDGLFSPNGGWIQAPAPKGLTFPSTDERSAAR